MDTPFFALSDAPLPVAQILQLIQSDDCGAIDAFIGTVRQATQGREVIALEFEAYDPMAIKEMQKIAARAQARWPVKKMAIYHRKGRLEIGEVAVVIAVSTPHRAAAFEACQFAIDTLKETVPIWKKEYFVGGEIWIAAHP